MNKILFMNCSPNRNGNTYRIGEKILEGKEHNILQMADYKISQYGQVYEDDQIGDVFKEIEKADTLLIGAPVYWYTVGGILKTFIDRLYMLPEAEVLKGKKFYFVCFLPSAICNTRMLVRQDFLGIRSLLRGNIHKK